jgi:DNA-binding protein H-NS
MDIQSLTDLRKRIDKRLLECRADIERPLARLYRSIGDTTTGGRKRQLSSLRGRKVPPKYRSRSGETWAGRGAKPRWLVAALKGGKKLDDFLIDKPSRRGPRKKRRSKRGESFLAPPIRKFAEFRSNPGYQWRVR